MPQAMQATAVHAPVLSRLAAELTDTSHDFTLEAMSPRVREKWKGIVGSNPGVLAREMNRYPVDVNSYFRDLEDAGRSMALVGGGDLQRELGEVRDGIARYNGHLCRMGRRLRRIKALLNASDQYAVNRDDLLRLARHYLAWKAADHDAGNLISAVDLYIQSGISNRVATVNKIGEHVARVGRGGMHMMTKSPVSQVSVSRLADDLASLFGRIGAGLHIEYSTDDVTFDGDECNLYRCFHALAENARSRGGATRLRIASSADGHHAGIEVADNGTGLPNKANEAGIFEYGVSHFNGRGLGLFMARQVIEAHGGSIRAVAHNGDPVYSGAAFRLAFPAERKEAVQYSLLL